MLIYEKCFEQCSARRKYEGLVVKVMVIFPMWLQGASFFTNMILGGGQPRGLISPMSERRKASSERAGGCPGPHTHMWQRAGMQVSRTKGPQLHHKLITQ